MFSVPSSVAMLLTLWTTLCAVLLVTLLALPIMGAVVRLRANYNPKAIQLDPEGGVQPRTGPVITSVSAMLARVFRIEGFSGLYKGLVPTFLSIPITAALSLCRAMSNSDLPLDEYSITETRVMGSIAYILLSVIFNLPLKIIAYRAITTEKKLPYFNVCHSIRALLTPTELQRPWILYLTPGLLAAELSQVIYIILSLWTLQVLPLLEPSDPGSEGILFAFVGMVLALMLAGIVVLLAPLEVIFIRLATQQNHVMPGSNRVSEDNSGPQDVAEPLGNDEAAVSLRMEQEPYAGVVDCMKKITEEEGWGALYRAWWWTLLFKQ